MLTGSDQQVVGRCQLEQLGLGVGHAECAHTRLDAVVFFDRFNAGQELLAIADPVAVSRRLIAVPFLADDLHQPSGGDTERATEEERDRNMAICTWPKQLNEDVAESDAPGLAFEHGVAVRVGENHRLGGLGRRLLGRDIDVLPMP